MPNKLRDVFSNKNFEMGVNLRFRDHEAQNKFLETLQIAYNEGRAMKVDGVFAISTYAKDGDTIYPLMVESEPMGVVVGPPVENVPVKVDTACGEKLITLLRYQTNNDLIIRTSENAVVFLKFAYRKGGNQLQFTYRIQLHFAKKAKDVAENYCEAIGILNCYFKPNNKQDASGDLNSLLMIKRAFQITYSFWRKLSLIEDEFKVSFDPAKIGNIDDNMRDVEQLYLLLIKKKAVRLDAKLTSTTFDGIALKSNENTLKTGQAIGLTFTSEITYSICEQSITIYTANFINCAVIKEIIETEASATKILYDDTDSMPMYISCTGYKTPDEAIKESNLIVGDKERIKKYKEALTMNEYYK